MKQSTQNYLKTIFSLGYPNLKKKVKPSDIAKKLDVSPAAVTDMLKKLESSGYAKTEPYAGVTLTQEGIKVGCNMVRHHRLWESFLSQVLNIPWDKVHDEAERLEHACSDELINKIESHLGFPKFDPHGNPIPDINGNIPKPIKDTQLVNCKAGQSAKISRVVNTDESFLNYLRKKGVYLGKEIHLKEILDFDGTLVCEVDGESLSLSKQAAEHIFVEV
jgi:DtxR family transcriptional regulator, Mn-dependent transcriptional regulator